MNIGESINLDFAVIQEDYKILFCYVCGNVNMNMNVQDIH